MKNMKNIVKPLAVFSTAALLMCASGCGDTSWSFKTDDDTISNGTYIYYTYMAYNEASSKIEEEASAAEESSDTAESSASSTESEVSEESVDILTQKIEDKTAEEWIADKAKEECIAQLTMDKLIKEHNVEVDEEEIEIYTSYYEQYYQYGSSFYTELGISKESYLNATGRYTGLSEQLFYSIYDKGGSKEVPSEDIEKYFTENYINYFCIPYSLKTTDDDGNKTDIDDETMDKVKTNFAKYADMLNKGSSTDDVVEKYKTDFEVTDDPSQSDNIIVEDSGMGDEFKKVINGLKEKEATVTSIDDTYYLIYKGAIKDQVSTLSDDSTQMNQRTEVLHKMKDDEFKKYLDDEEAKLKYETNDACLSRYSVKSTVDKINSMS